MRLEPGTPIDVWCVETRLGSGGMGAVYRCFNRSAPRIRAALKVLDPTLAYDPEIRGRFIREAELLFQLDHPNIVKVRNVNMDASPPFIEMAFCQGNPLDAVLRQGALPVGVAALIGAQLAEALSHVHAQGIRHRDVKPGNVIINGDHATLVDFGIATEGAARTMNLRGSALGTVAYAPPEWGGRSSADPTLWDAYSLGQLIWECITGTPAFRMPDDMDLREGVFHLLSLKLERGALELPESSPEPLRELVRSLTHPDVNQRTGDLKAAAAILYAHATRDTGFLEEVPPLGDPDVEVLTGGAGGSDTMFFVDMDDEGPEADSPDVPNLAGWSSDAAPGLETVADATLATPEVASPPAAASPDPPARRSPLGLAIGGVVVLAIAGALTMLGGEPEEAPSEEKFAGNRPVQLIHKGTQPTAPITTLVDGRPVAEGAPLSLSPGSHRFEVVVGEGCASESGQRPRWCGTSKRSTNIPDGVGPITITVQYPEPAPPPASLALSGASASQLRIDGGPWKTISGEAHSLTELAPGPHTLLIRGGTCPEEAPCPESCPPTCSEVSAEVVIPFKGDEPIPVAAVVPERTEVKKSSGGGSGGRVTQKQFAAWLKRNAQYAPEQVRGTRVADSNYVKGWSIEAPSNRAADQVPPTIAATYCGKKGLAPATAAPTSWPEGAISYEIRSGANGQPVLLHFSGSVSKARSSQSTPTVGFRCR